MKETGMPIKTQKATAKATEAAKQVIAVLESGESADVTWESFKDVKRNDFEKSPELIKLVFSMPNPEGLEKGALAGIDIEGDYYIAKLEAVNVPSVSDIKDQERKTIERVVGSGLGNAEYQVFQTALKAKASVEKI